MARRNGGGWVLWLIPAGVAASMPLAYASQDDLEVSSDSPWEGTELAAEPSSDGETLGMATADTSSWEEKFATSLHATAQGMKTWYDKSSSGFEDFTGIPYAQLHCKSCHEPRSTGGCVACHNDPTPPTGARVDASLEGVCGGCHSRQMAEATYYSDVHRDLGMGCMMCHTKEDVMGDGITHSSMLEDGAIDADCESCHLTLGENPYHRVHQETVDCTACHTQSVVSCYNCHFETEVQLDRKVAYGQFRDWVFLLNRDGKVHAANFQAVKHGTHTFVALAPFYAHTISRSARECLDCHGSPAVRDYLDDGVIDVVRWDKDSGSLKHMEGVVPVPSDFRTALRFDFVDLDRPGGTDWSFLEAGPDRIQILFGEPLTRSQMKKLGYTALWRSSGLTPLR